MEGAQATLLDIDFGSYPYVTSSNPTIGGILTGTGLSASDIGNVYGVIKAYSSRVGAGPYVTELLDETGDRIRELGHEYGTTTGRPRRCGWLDLVTLKYAKRLNGLTGLSVNHLDTIGKFDTIKVCTGYDVNGEVTEDFTTNLNVLNNAKPVYKELKGGWDESIADCKTFDELPEEAKSIHQFHRGVYRCTCKIHRNRCRKRSNDRQIIVQYDHIFTKECSQIEHSFFLQ